jgi:hypothetical protein
MTRPPGWSPTGSGSSQPSRLRVQQHRIAPLHRIHQLDQRVRGHPFQDRCGGDVGGDTVRHGRRYRLAQSSIRRRRRRRSPGRPTAAPSHGRLTASTVPHTSAPRTNGSSCGYIGPWTGVGDRERAARVSHYLLERGVGQPVLLRRILVGEPIARTTGASRTRIAALQHYDVYRVTSAA